METHIEKPSSFSIWPLAAMEEKPNAVMSSNIFDANYLTRLRSGDEETAKHFNTYFRRMLRIKLWAKFGRTVQDDLMEDVLAAALEKILNGEPRDPSCLAAYVRGICANLAKRPDPNTNRGSDFNFEHISDRALTAEEQMISRERARTVRAVLTSLKTRDRLILIDLFYNDLHREEVCRRYKVSREQLRLILFRARGRFQKKWLPQ
jgi:RNA polymerase sigma factor (sigma-70 family)